MKTDLMIPIVRKTTVVRDIWSKMHAAHLDNHRTIVLKYQAMLLELRSHPGIQKGRKNQYQNDA